LLQMSIDEYLTVLEKKMDERLTALEKKMEELEKAVQPEHISRVLTSKLEKDGIY